MNTRFLLTAIGSAMIAFGKSLMASADAAPEDIEGVFIGTEDTNGVDAATVTDATRDSAGLPWHPAIHAATKTQKADGTWTKRRGCSEVEYNAVVAELRKTHPAPTPPATSGTPALTPLAGPTTGITLPQLGTVPLNPYQELCAWLAANTGDGKKIPTDYVNQSFANSKVSLAELAPPENHIAAKSWLEAFKGVLASAG